MISWIASGLVLVGNIVIIYKKHWFAFVIFIVGNSLFAYDWFVKKEWPVFILVCVFLIQNVLGIIQWRIK